MSRTINIGVDVLPLGVKQKPITLNSYVACYYGTAHGTSGTPGNAPIDKHYKIESLDQYKAVFGWSNNSTSTGTVKFSFTAASGGETIAKGTEVSTAEGIVFITDTLYTAVGGDTSKELAVTAKVSGADSNVNAGTLTTVDTSTISGLTNVTVTNDAPTSGGADSIEPDTDYTLEQVAYLHFAVYNVGAIVVKNVYDSSNFPGGVSTVAASDFTPSDLENIQVETGETPLWFAIPEFGHDTSLFNAMLTQRNLLGLFAVKIMIGYDPSVTNRATVISAMGSGSAFRKKNVEVSWPPLNSYASEIHKVCKKMQMMGNSNQGQGMPYWSTSNKTTELSYIDSDIKQNYKEAQELVNVGVTTFMSNGGNVVNWGSKTAYFWTGLSSPPDDAYVYDNDGASDQANYNHNNTVFLLWNDIGNPLNTTSILQVVNKINDLGEAQVNTGAMIGYGVDFLKSDNSSTDLANNIITIRERFLPAAQIDTIKVKTTLDFSMFANLFS